MSFIVILFTTLVIFLFYRYSLSLIATVIAKVFKGLAFPDKGDLLLSIAFWAIYEKVFWEATFQVPAKFNFMLSDLYLVLLSTGISSVLWIYFKWDLRLTSLPKPNPNKEQVRIKKIIIFTCVMVFSFFLGYKQFMCLTTQEQVDITASLTNFSLVPGIIAFDRVLSQLHEQWFSKKN